MCVHVLMCMCTLLSSKWGDKGGAESLMSSLTGCIHVSLCFSQQTPAALGEAKSTKHCMQHTLTGGWDGERNREKRCLSNPGRRVWRTFYPGCLQQNDIHRNQRTSMHFDMFCVPWVYKHVKGNKVKRALQTGDHTTSLTQKQKQSVV